jgi:hypothetical protein
VTPTARTLELLRRSGYLVAVVESWVPRVNARRDLFGFADVLAVSPHREPRFLLVQATTTDHVAGRLTKARGCPALRTWLQAGGAFVVDGWFKRDGRWQVRRVEVKLGDLDLVTVAPPRSRRRRRSRQPELFPS